MKGVQAARSAAGWAGSIVSWTVLLVSACALVVLVFIPAVTQSGTFTVLSGSMTPTLKPGDLIVTRLVPEAELKVGDVITYQLRSGEPEVVTHRIVGLGFLGSGERVFTTRGDANTEVDEKPVRYVQVRGELWYHVPLLGYANSWLSGPWRALIISCAFAMLAAYAVIMFVAGARDAVRRRNAAQSGTPSRPAHSEGMARHLR